MKAAKTTDWKPSGYLSIVVFTDDGPYEYCDLDNSIRKLTPNDDNVGDDVRMREYGFNLRDRMSDAGVSQDQLSETTGISRQMLSRYMNGKSSPTFVNAVRISKVLKCSLEDFLDETKLNG